MTSNTERAATAFTSCPERLYKTLVQASLGFAVFRGVRLFPGGSAATTPLSGDLNNNLAPDAIELGGNFSTVDDYPGFVSPTNPAGGCGGQAFAIAMSSVAGYRLAANGVSAASVLQAAFHPGNPASPQYALTQYMLRMTDNSGKTMYAVTCTGSAATSYVPGPPAVAYINFDPNTKFVDQSQGVPWNAKATGNGFLRINPVQIVHWDLRQASTLPTSFKYGVAGSDAKEYVLTRQFVDAQNLVDPSTLEVIAEYAVDLKFAFTVDTTPYGLLANPGQYTAGASPLAYLPLDVATNGTWAYDVSAFPYRGSPTVGPQRIRSVRLRLATRTALADRSQNPPPVPPPGPGAPYLYRYCVNPPCAVGSQSWARVRTLVTEVALENQARLYY